jgi:hypothetical protein
LVVPVRSSLLEVAIDLDPNTLNCRSNGRWVTCYIEPPEPYLAEDIDVSSLRLEGINAADRPVNIGDHDADGIPDLMVKFDRATLCAFLSPGECTIELTGQLLDGTPLAGADAIRVIP